MGLKSRPTKVTVLPANGPCIPRLLLESQTARTFGASRRCPSWRMPSSKNTPSFPLLPDLIPSKATDSPTIVECDSLACLAMERRRRKESGLSEQPNPRAATTGNGLKRLSSVKVGRIRPCHPHTPCAHAASRHSSVTVLIAPLSALLCFLCCLQTVPSAASRLTWAH